MWYVLKLRIFILEIRLIMNDFTVEFDQSKVLVVGDLMLDSYWFGQTARISPEAPVPVVNVKQSEFRAGGAANVAMNIKSLGATPHLMGFVGKDENATKLTQLLDENKINTNFIAVDGFPTITKLRILSRNQQLLRLDFEESFNDLDSLELLEEVKIKLADYKVMLLSDYGKGSLKHVQEMIKQANLANVKVLVDPKGRDFSKYSGATLITPNMSEFEDCVGKCKDEAEIEAKALNLLEKYNIQALLITRSEKGMTLVRRGYKTFNLPTQAKEVFDVTGAGDTVIGTLAASIAQGYELEKACFIANAAAGVVVGKIGTSTLSLQELENAMHLRDEDGFGIMNLSELKQAVKLAQLKGETIVMTNGCFDILHPGHVSYLQAARRLGDRLIVAVNSDQSVRKLKGQDRPINGLKDRMLVLSGLSAVDWLIDFEEETPQQLIAQILPDILVKGGDYKVEDIAGGAEVIANGGQVLVLNFKDGCSTSNIIKKIKTTN